jgi:CDP-glycerol glycerophosphotransferase (TagB/SpsB family)
LECGSPRSDALFHSDESTRQKVRDTLGIPADKKIVIYAPTFRGDENMGCYRMDFEGVLKALEEKTGDQWVFAVRLHPNVSDKADFIQYSDRIFNATNYPDLYELLPVCDFVISDYSSVMFDGGLIGKPVMLFATDVQEYTADRNFYFDITDMPFALAQKLGVEDVYYCAYSLQDPSQRFAIADEINEKFSDIVAASATEEDSVMDLYAVARNAMTVIIYVISIVFSLVVVMMVCKKAFLQERRDIGIYKSLGFTSAKLRLQFAVRFLIVSIIGSAVGTVLSFFFTEKVLTMVFRLLGISSFNAQFTVVSFAVPVAIIAVSFFGFAYLASSRIKTVEIKELVVE